MINAIKGLTCRSELEISEGIMADCGLNSYEVLGNPLATIRCLERNVLNVDPFKGAECSDPSRETTEKDSYFATLCVYDSIKRKKQTELVCSVTNTFEFMAMKINCSCVQIDLASSFKRFFYLEDVIICDNLPSSDDTMVKYKGVIKFDSGIEKEGWEGNRGRGNEGHSADGRGVVYGEGTDLPRPEQV